MVARRREHTRDEMVALVTRAAEKLGARDGLRGITMRGLAAAVGYAPNSIYHSVGDIDTVILRLNARTLDRITRALGERLKPNLGSEDTVYALAEGYMDFVAANHRLWSILVDYAPRREKPFPDWYQAAFARPLGLVGEALAPLFPDPADRRRSVAVLWASLHGIASLSFSGKLRVISDDAAPTLARLLVSRFLAGREPGGAR